MSTITRAFAAISLIPLAVGSAQMAAADPAVPEAGSPCVHEEINDTSLSPGGTPLRCLNDASGYTWQVDTGVAAVDPATAGQQDWVNCVQSSHTPSECAHILRGAPPPATGATATHIPGSGTFQIGVDVVSGVYESRGGIHKSPCVWSIYAADNPSNVIDQGSSYGRQLLKITATQRGTLEISNCAPWTRSQEGSPVF
jgi:hypothetical protein